MNRLKGYFVASIKANPLYKRNDSLGGVMINIITSFDSNNPSKQLLKMLNNSHFLYLCTTGTKTVAAHLGGLFD